VKRRPSANTSTKSFLDPLWATAASFIAAMSAVEA
jgi:hypothetical protein